MNNSLIALSKPFATGIDWVQSAGGNTSVKRDNEMLIKASGLRLNSIKQNFGFVGIDYKKVKDFFMLENQALENPNAESKAFITNCIIGDATFLPSMETGFHAVLKDFVVHTHPIILNTVLCSEQSRDIVEGLFNEFSYIPYTAPGYHLSRAVADSDRMTTIFLENHGLITHSNSLEEAVTQHKEVIDKIKEKFSFSPIELPILESSEEISTYCVDKEIFSVFSSFDLSQNIFPDQAVFLHQKISFDEASGKPIIINKNNQTITYKYNPERALAVHEVLYSILWIVQNQHRLNLKTTFISGQDVANILGMDMEKYRQSLQNK